MLTKKIVKMEILRMGISETKKKRKRRLCILTKVRLLTLRGNHMTSLFLLFLFILQIISFYFLALMYTKLSKFDNLEKQQRKLMNEMDDSIGAYLSELKDE